MVSVVFGEDGSELSRDSKIDFIDLYAMLIGNKEKHNRKICNRNHEKKCIKRIFQRVFSSYGRRWARD